MKYHRFDYLIARDTARYAVQMIPNWGLWAACRYAKNRDVPAEIFIKEIKVTPDPEALKGKEPTRTE